MPSCEMTGAPIGVRQENRGPTAQAEADCSRVPLSLAHTGGVRFGNWRFSVSLHLRTLGEWRHLSGEIVGDLQQMRAMALGDR